MTRRLKYASNEDLLERNTIPVTETGCLLWTGYKDPKWGYGQVRILGRGLVKAHRLAYETWKGDPSGLNVCHKCDTPLCCNPDHLFLGTHADNVNDKVAKGRHCFGEGNGRSKLLENDARKVKELSAQGMSQTGIAKLLHVHQSTIHYIVSGKTWRHLAA